MPVELHIPEGIPVRRWDDGTYRVEATRLLLWMVLEDYKNGRSVEWIAEAYQHDEPVIRRIVRFYVDNRRQLDLYLKEEREESARILAKLEERGLLMRGRDIREKCDDQHRAISKERVLITPNTPA